MIVACGPRDPGEDRQAAQLDASNVVRVPMRTRDPKAQDKTFDLIAKHGSATPRMLIRKFRITLGAARARLDALVNMGLLVGPVGEREIYRGVTGKTGGASK